MNNYKIMQFLFLRVIVCLIALILTAGTSLAKTGNLVSMVTYPLTSLTENDNISNILAIEDSAIALGESFFWQLDAKTGQWQATSWEKQGQIKGVVNDGHQVFLFSSSAQEDLIDQVVRFQLPNIEGDDDVPMLSFPPLKTPLISAQGTFLQGLLFVAGISVNGLPMLMSIDPLAENPEWVSYETWSGSTFSAEGVKVTSVVGQNSNLYVTVADGSGGGDRLLQWNLVEGWQEKKTLLGTIMHGGGRAIGQGHIIYIVKDISEDRKKSTLMSYHVITGAWATYGDIEPSDPDLIAGWKSGFLLGQVSEGSNGVEFVSAEIETGKQLLHVVDWFVIGAYLLCMLGMGLYFYTRHAQDSKSDFFLGGRSIPFWAAGISLYASNASSISYIAVPAKAFATNWQYLMSNLIVVLGLMLVAVWIVPLIRRLNLMSIFQYLETRFHPSIRVLSSALFIVFQLGGRMTIILFLPSLAISTVTGIDVAISILIMGGITIIYTVLGGMKAVIWTDVMQLFVMFGGTIFAIIFVLLMLDGGIDEFFTTAIAEDKMKMLDWSFDLTKATVWGFVFLVFFDTVLTFPKDQVLMQRVLSTETAKDAGRSVWTFALIVIPGSVMFYVVGTALYVFYQSHPERMDPSLSVDATFPLFIAAELPMGVTGLIIAGIFAASMSTLSSILNSVATLATVDFYEKIYKNSAEKTTVRFAEIVTVIGGVIGIGLALLLSRFEVQSLLDLALELWGLLGGGFAGAYTLGMFTRRSNWQGVSIGVAISIAITLVAWTVNLIHPYFYLPFSVMICIVVGYVASWFFPAPSDLKGLTIFKEDTIA